MATNDIDVMLEPIPPIRHSDRLWCANCREVSKLNAFSAHTLLYRPDCRLFCPDGLRCKLMHEEHRALFLHVEPQRLQAEVAASPPTVVVNRPTLVVGVLPRIPCCTALPMESAEELQQPRRSAQRVFVWVHGFRQGYVRVINVAAHLAHQLGIKEGAASNAAVATFLWPCHKKKLAYGLARHDAREAGQRLRVLLQALAAYSSAEVVLVGHSMGCRVALHALAAPTQDTAAASPLCARLVVLGGAVDAKCLAAGGEFERGRLRVGGDVVICYSRHDETLAQHFWVGEATSGGGLWSTAIGLVGARGCEHAAVRSVDVSASVPGHNPNLWLKSGEVMQCIQVAGEHTS